MNNKYYVWVQYGLFIVLSMVALSLINLFYALLEHRPISSMVLFLVMMVIIAGFGTGIIALYKFIMVKLFGEEARI